MRWGATFEKTLGNPETSRDWLCGPFAEKRGFDEGTVLNPPHSGQLKGSGWFEPGQALFHWAALNGYTWMVCQYQDCYIEDGTICGTLYGRDKQSEPLNRVLTFAEMEGCCYAAHTWGSTRALDIVKHAVSDQFVAGHTHFWLKREAAYWLEVVPQEIREQTLELVRQHGWHYPGQGVSPDEARNKEAAEWVNSIYREGGIAI